MSDTTSARDILQIVDKPIDEIAREFGNLELYDPRRGPLLEELSGLTQLRTWLRSEPNRLLTQPMEELARALATLNVDGRRRVQIIAEIISWSPAMKEH